MPRNMRVILYIGFVKRSVMEVGIGSFKISNFKWWAMWAASTK